MLVQRKEYYYLKFNKDLGKYLNRLTLPLIFFSLSRNVVLKGLQADMVCLLIDCTVPTVPTALSSLGSFLNVAFSFSN